MKITFLEKIFVIVTVSTFHRTISSKELQDLSSECILLDDNFEKDCVIICTESELSSNSQDCSVEIKSLNDSNMFIEIPENFKKDVTILELSGSGVSFLPHGIRKVLPNLLKISVQTTSIKTASKENFKYLTNLSTLKLSNSELTDICGTSFFDLESLIEIDLSINEIKFLNPNLFSKNFQLQKIDLNSNLLEILHPMLFSLLQNLSIVDLSYNDIIFIDRRQFLHNKQLSELQLFGNNIKAIEYGSFDGLGSLNVLTIEENLCIVNFVPEYNDEGNILNVTLKFINKKCSEIREYQHEIEEKINSYNKWFRSKYVADKCGSDEIRDYIPFSPKSSGVKLNHEIQIWVLMTLIVVNYFKSE